MDGDGVKDSIVEKKPDSEIGFHPAALVHRVMMNVMEPPGRQEPATEKRIPRHPEIGKMHTIVKIVESKNGPADQHGEHDGLIENRDVEEEHNRPQDAENDRRGDQPFEADIANRKAIVGSVMVVVVAHGLPGAINQKVMN